MEPYSHRLKEPARLLRSAATSAEQRLWERVRRKQVGGVQFYRQKPLLGFIVDFYCPARKLVVELDGLHHRGVEQLERDQDRDARLGSIGLRVIRFTNREIETDLDAVVATLTRAITRSTPQLSSSDPRSDPTTRTKSKVPL